MNEVSSPYYPPRARWYGPVLAGVDRLRHRLALDRISPPPGVSLARIIASALVPGLGFYFRSPRIWGRAALALAILLLLVFFVGFGYPTGNLTFGLLLSLHTSSLAFLLEPWLGDSRLRTRILVAVCLLVGLSGLVYWPARSYLEHHWVMPLQVHGHVVIIHRSIALGSLQRGDWVAYSLPGSSGEGIYINEGAGFGQVLALPGDRVRFSALTFEIAGLSRPRLAHMPASGELIVPEKHWLVWPDFAISGHGNVSEGVISKTMLELGNISEDRLLGQPFRRWLWRQQIW
jgi:hypothetical protein